MRAGPGPRRPAGCRAWHAAVLAALVVLAASRAGAQAPRAGSVELGGATRVEIDDARGIWRAEGAPAELVRGDTRLRAPRLRYDARAGVVAAEGGVEVAAPGLEARADRMELRLADEWLRATGDVRLAATQGAAPVRVRAPDVQGSLRTRRFAATGGVALTRGEAVLTGRRVDYDDGTRTAIATGEPELRLREAILQAQTLVLQADEERITGQGDVRVRRGDLLATAARVDLRLREGAATLAGGARAQRGGDVLVADEIVMALDGSSVVARGSPRLTVATP